MCVCMHICIYMHTRSICLVESKTSPSSRKLVKAFIVLRAVGSPFPKGGKGVNVRRRARLGNKKNLRNLRYHENKRG